MRRIDKIIIHASDTPADMDVGAEEIREWHVDGNGWRDIGYHWVIRRSGRIEPGRDESVVGAHVAGKNANSIGVCLVGGRGADGSDDCNYTAAQWASLASLVGELQERFPDASVSGHRDHSSKACPCFDVAAWWSERSDGGTDAAKPDKASPSASDDPLPPGHVLLLGGVRSGKSAWAQRLARRSGKAVRFIATATADDDEMAERIKRHQAERPDDWTLIEEPDDLVGAIESASGSGDCLLIDCLSLWLSNRIEKVDADDLNAAGAELAEAVADYDGPLILVSNEVGLGGVAMNRLARRYADALGRLNQQLAARCERVAVTMAGKLLPLKGGFPAGDSLHQDDGE